MNNFLAKSKKNSGTSLKQHTLASMHIANVICKNFIIDMERIIPGCIYSSGTHDIGKINKNLQDYFSGNIKTKKLIQDTEDGSDPILPKCDNIPHNVISWAFLKNCTTLGRYNNSMYNAINSGVLFHHVVEGEYDSPVSILNKYYDDVDKMCEFFNFVKETASSVFGVDSIDGEKVELCENNDKKSLVSSECVYPIMENRRNIKGELEEFSEYFLIRAIGIISDRLSSSFSQEELDAFCSDEKRIEEFLNQMCSSNIGKVDISFEYLVEHGYNGERLKNQINLVDTICSNKNTILSSSAGSGKTLIGILTSIKMGKKTVWVVPTNNTAMSTYNSVCRDLDSIGIGDKVSVSLYYSGHFEFGDEESDILVTNIDTFLGTMIKNSISHWLFKFMNGTIIFDEYHEFFGSPNAPMFSAYIATAYCLMKHTKSTILNMSATAHRYDEVFWGENIVSYLSADIYGGDTQIKVNIKKYNDVSEFNDTEKDSITIMYSIPNVTNYGYDNSKYDCVYAHSRFPEAEKYSKVLEVLNNNGKGSDELVRKPLVGTSFIGFAFDITSKNMYDFAVSPDTTIQRCGRLNRFCKFDGVSTYNMCVLTNGRTPKIVTESYDGVLLNRWINAVSSIEGKVVSKEFLYKMYDKFHEDNKIDIVNLYMNRFIDSSRDLTKLLPYHSRVNVTNEDMVLPKDMLTMRGITRDIYVVAYRNDGTLSKPIKINKIYIYNLEKNITRDRYKSICKLQYRFFEDKINKYSLEKQYGLKGWEDILFCDVNSVKYDMARNPNSPLLLTNEEAIFDNTIGLILKKG